MIRSATPGDADGIASIYNHYVKESVVTFEVDPVSTAEMQSRIEAACQYYPWLVDLDDDVIRGYAYASQWKPRAAYRHTVETSVYVGPRHIGFGVGERLYRALLERVTERGFHAVLGGIALPNPASVALHEKLGFRKVGELEQVGFKHDRWVNVGYWQRIL
jgi:phosphinothricin acetyltransferase